MKINKNIAWAKSFVDELAAGGVKYACISPGSRNTPLSWAFANNKRIRKFIIIDERSSGFFALGLANRSGSPVALVCTSGTAAVEFYPAIVEAFQQRIPLIVCTADRPRELRDTGTNQTINQDNLYKNHIRFFIDVGIPELSIRKITSLKKTAGKAIQTSCHKNKGPVHINFPFNKPFEPFNTPDQISNKANSLLKKTNYILPGAEKERNLLSENWILNLIEDLKNIHRGIIVVGPERLNDEFHKNIIRLSKILKYPILADGCSQLRFLTSSGIQGNNNIICNYEAMLRSHSFSEAFLPEIILHFGRTSTSKGMEDFYGNHSPLKIIINEEGDFFDPTRKGKSYKIFPSHFCKIITESLQKSKIIRDDNKWINPFLYADQILEQLKQKTLFNSQSINEIRIINEILDIVPAKSSIMLSNSLPVRDFDYWASCSSKEFKIFNNRGASGIDGIISTALGIASVRKEPVFLITGDLAFYYDLNSLMIAEKYSIPLIIILINNNGGGIFNSLPVSRYPGFLKEYFITPHNLNFEKLTKAFDIDYSKVKTWQGFKGSVKRAITNKKTVVIEIQTDAVKSLELRKLYWKESERLLNNMIKA
ncbi:MAG: 2-succinyl-5-enolpyruvyl-6-hydroxy-3-cyclohexene-1-carboxylic-acid synthase [Ignavibacteriaceae bacterium]|nr:2-succinyl-5-enolpyruvyl-6-hydroxy-3-cyclohexene-1-carboxylic-acid synthase [Ignavibacteriaceae bacterium]